MASKKKAAETTDENIIVNGDSADGASDEAEVTTAGVDDGEDTGDTEDDADSTADGDSADGASDDGESEDEDGDEEKSFVALRSILYLSRQYAAGDTLPTNNPDMVSAWIEAGSAAWVDAKKKA